MGPTRAMKSIFQTGGGTFMVVESQTLASPNLNGNDRVPTEVAKGEVLNLEVIVQGAVC